jgi:hypothetical protein
LRFFSRERNVADVAERAWTDRLRVTIIPEQEGDHLPRRIILHPTPYQH